MKGGKTIDREVSRKEKDLKDEEETLGIIDVDISEYEDKIPPVKSSIINKDKEESRKQEDIYGSGHAPLEDLMEEKEKRRSKSVMLTPEGEGRIETLTDNRKDNLMIIQQFKAHQREDEKWGKDNVAADCLSRPVRLEEKIIETHDVLVGSLREKKEKDSLSIIHEDNQKE